MVRQSPVSLSHKLQLPSSQVVTSTLSLCALLKSMSRRASFSPLSPLHHHTFHLHGSRTRPLTCWGAGESSQRDPCPGVKV